MYIEHNNKDYIILMGNFGSGKTELALHFAMSAAKAGSPTALVDLDMVNPYFRASDRQKCLEKLGIRLITPNYAMSNVEAIMINPEIYAAFSKGEGTSFSISAVMASGLRHWDSIRVFPAHSQGEIKDLLVVNPLRPLSATAELIMQMLEKIEANSRLEVNGLINNSNLGVESSIDDLLYAYPIVKEVSERKQIPVVLTSGKQEILAEFIEQERQN